MTGSTRLTSTASSVRAPYTAPQTTATSHLPATRNFDPETGAPLRLPAPFVPREFRATVRSDVTIVPAATRVEESNVIGVASTASATSISELFTNDVIPASDFASFIESHARDESETAGSAELPWIDAFAADAAESEETWPLDEAGKRLDELTQSLSSLDASRGRFEAERLRAQAALPKVALPEVALPEVALPEVALPEPAPPEAAVQMWNEEEWIDIMPTAPSEILPQDELHRSATSSDAVKHEAVSNGLLRTHSAESAARALEGLAHRVRAGEVQVPAFPTALGQEAMLAGLLASMLGWRQ